MVAPEEFEVSKVVAVPRDRQYRKMLDAARAVSACIRMQDLSRSIRSMDDRLDLRFSVDQVRNPPNLVAASLFAKSANEGILPCEIVLNPEHPELPMTYVHELGHCFDFYCVLPSGQFSSKTDKLFGRWRKAVRESAACRMIARVLVSKSIRIADDITGEECTYQKTPEFHEMLLAAHAYHEYWARAFAQYVLTDDSVADRYPWLCQMLERRANRLGNDVCAFYWYPQDFTQIRAEMDAIFASLRIK